MLEASRSLAKKLKNALGLRGYQADTVRKQLDASPYPLIICGDFNDVPNSYTYFHIRGNLQDAFIAKCFGIGRSYIHISPTFVSIIYFHPGISGYSKYETQFTLFRSHRSAHRPAAAGAESDKCLYLGEGMSNLKVYNSYTRQKEEFIPITPGHVGMYVCGPTVSGESHLGHARPYITFDVLYRYLLHLGYKVRYVRNITDAGHFEEEGREAEDKISKKAIIEKLEPMELVQKYTNLFHWAMHQFNTSGSQY